MDTVNGLEFCVDCALILGGVTDNMDQDFHDSQVRAIDYRWGEGYDLHLTNEGEPYFSWAPCDACGSTLGGDRYDGVALVFQDN